MNIVCSILGIGCILYYAILAIYAGPSFNFGWFWIAVGAALLLAAWLRQMPDKSICLWASRIILACLAAGFILLGILSALVISGMKTTAPGLSGKETASTSVLSYAIVLGAQVRGTNPSRALLKRLEAALKLAEDAAVKDETHGAADTSESPSPGSKTEGDTEASAVISESLSTAYEAAPDLAPFIILSGGQGDGEDISEAQCMWNYLTEHGVSKSRLLQEDKSTTTEENLRFSDRLYGCAGKPCAIITNDFHLYRALKIARKAGYEQVYGIAAEGDPLMEVHYVIREAVAILYGRLRGQF